MYIDKLSVGPLSTNCYILANENTKTCAVIDPGDDYERIIYKISSLGFMLSNILITHSHIDHIGAVDRLKQKTGADVVISTTDSATFNNNIFTLSDMLGTTAPVTPPDIKVNDGEIINICGVDVKIIATPGHTPGSICYYIESENILFSGDTLFYESIGRTDFPGGSYKSICESIKNKLYLLPGSTVVYPGHNCDTTILHEIESNFYI